MTQTNMLAGFALWLSTPNAALVEIARAAGFRRLVLDLEHGVFDDGPTETTIALARAAGVEVLAKVLGPEAIPIQRALDLGADGVVIPHIGDGAHAAGVTAHAKYPPLGDRSFSGGQVSAYGPPDDDFYARENGRILCLPMIETAAALGDVEAIVALATVDGLFIGPTDLSLSRGRGNYRNTDEDQGDLRRIAAAAKAAGKPWIMPAWTAAERELSRSLGADFMIVGNEFGLMAAGLKALICQLSK